MSGLGPQAAAFLAALAANNNRDWFHAGKAVYERDLKGPAEAFSAVLADRLSAAHGMAHAPRIFRIARDVRRTLANYEDLKDIIAMLGMEELSRDDRRTVNRARRLERFLTQPFFTTEQFTGHEGRMVDIDETLDGCQGIMNDEFHDYPERALYMIGGVDEVDEADKGKQEGERHGKGKQE